MAETVRLETFDQPAAQVTVETVQTIVIPATDMLSFGTKTFGIKNSGATAFNSGKIQATRVEVQGTDEKNPKRWTPSTVDADWEDVDTASFATLAGGAFKSATVKDDARKWFRVTATVAALTTTAKGYLTGRAL